MTVQLVLLKSGEEIVADVREIIDKETQKQISLVFIRPVRVTVTQQNTTDQESNQVQNVLNFDRWILTSKSEEFLVPHDWVVTTSEPTDNVKNSYIQNVGVKENGESSFIEDERVSDLGD